MKKKLIEITLKEYNERTEEFYFRSAVHYWMILAATCAILHIAG